MLTGGSEVIVDNPTLFRKIRATVVNVYIIHPGGYIGDMRVMLSCVLPLGESVVDSNDKLKSMIRGYGSMDYEHAGYRAAKMVKMDARGDCGLQITPDPGGRRHPRCSERV